jgi:hypothetical protein
MEALTAHPEESDRRQFYSGTFNRQTDLTQKIKEGSALRPFLFSLLVAHLQRFSRLEDRHLRYYRHCCFE